ncbi:MAG: helix-turn-helix domain-containing protein [Eubacterium sp.]|nr:helix-turn-helix domain-containing protein [Eubacterium sp.]
MTTINNEKKTLGERIREHRILMKMTQEELAEALHIKKSTVSMYENDKVDIKGSILVELSRTLNTSPNYLLGLEDNKELIEIAIMLKAINDENLRQSVVNHIKLLSAL